MKFEYSLSLGNLIGKRKFTLASGSPRRIELLRKAGIEFEIKTPKIDEEKILTSPEEYVLKLSKIKAESVLSEVESGIILGADTIVVLNGEILGKPNSREEAMLILSKLSNREHKVYTGLTLIDKDKNKIISDYECTKVKFKPFSNKEIDNYISTGEPLDKAGAYGIQNEGDFLVKSIEGPLDNVIGLPMKKLEKMLTRMVGEKK